jgi:hypothetical protein
MSGAVAPGTSTVVTMPFTSMKPWIIHVDEAMDLAAVISIITDDFAGRFDG